MAKRTQQLDIVVAAQDKASATLGRVEARVKTFGNSVRDVAIRQLRGAVGGAVAGGVGASGRSAVMSRGGTGGLTSAGLGAALGAVSRRLGVTSGVVGLTLAVRSVISTFAGFEQSMANVKAILQPTEAQFEKLNHTVRELGRVTQFTASEVGEAAFFFAQAGFSLTEIQKALPATLSLAAAGGLGIAEAADIAAGAMAGFGMQADEVDRISDVLAIAATKSKTDIQSLGEALQHIGPLAKTTGKDISEIAAVLGVFANANIEAEEAGTALRNILLELSTNGGKALKDLGISVSDENRNFRHLADIIEDVRQETQRFGDTSRLATIETIVGRRAMAAFTSAVNVGGDAIRDFERSIDEGVGESARIATERMNTLIGATQRLTSAWQEFQISITGQVEPALRSFLEFYAETINNLTGPGVGANTGGVLDKLAFIAATDPNSGRDRRNLAGGFSPTDQQRQLGSMQGELDVKINDIIAGNSAQMQKVVEGFEIPPDELNRVIADAKARQKAASREALGGVLGSVLSGTETALAKVKGIVPKLEADAARQNESLALSAEIRANELRLQGDFLGAELEMIKEHYRERIAVASSTLDAEKVVQLQTLQSLEENLAKQRLTSSQRDFRAMLESSRFLAGVGGGGNARDNPALGEARKQTAQIVKQTETTDKGFKALADLLKSLLAQRSEAGAAF